MARRTIKTSNGKKYSGSVSNFIDCGEYIEYQKNFFTIEKIYKKLIVYESDTSIFTLVAVLTFTFMLTTLAILGWLKIPKFYNNSLELAKVEKLIEQPSIDLLTEYLNQYQANKSKTSYVEQVKSEIEKRCYKLESNLKLRKNNHGYINNNLKDSYKSSCPEVIKKF